MSKNREVMAEDCDLDRLIDAALKTYAESHTDANLAGRVLTRIANEPARRPRLGWLAWSAVALPAAICLLLLVHFGPRTTKPRVIAPMQSAQVHTGADRSVPPSPHATRKAERAREIRRAAPHPHALVAATAPQPLPKLDVFPTPTPPTPQERALATYVAKAPKAEQQALAQSEQEPNPLNVASMRVMPLEAPDEGANTN
jgi:hypothetical protein